MRAHLNVCESAVDVMVAVVGPLGSGKRTLLARYEHLQPPRGKITWTDEAHDALAEGAVFFDFLPPNVHFLGRPVRVHLATSPDPDKPRALAFGLKRANVAIFVADSTPARLDANVAALRAVEAHVDRADLPFVFLLNKRDVPGAVPSDALREALAIVKAPCFEGAVPEGAGHAAVKAAVRTAMDRHHAITAAAKR